MRKLALHWQILIGMGLGVVIGLLFSFIGISDFAKDWIAPFGKIFINLLKLIAIPLILVSLIKGVANLSDISKLSRIGTKTLGIYIITTVFAVLVGLSLVNTLQPGNSFSAEKKAEFEQQYKEKVNAKTAVALEVQNSSPLQFLVDIVPSNIFNSMSNNKAMLQVIFFAVFFGICILLVPPKTAQPVIDLIDGLNEIVMKMIDLIMKFAPFGVFALLVGLIADFAGNNPAEAAELFVVMGYYTLIVAAGLLFMIFAFYPAMIIFLVRYPYLKFFKGISPAQLLAFSTSSSAATLPVTMECVETNLKVPKQISSFVLPVGATVNMDGTSLYQAIAAVFLAQVYGIDLTMADQLTIIISVVLASIGSAGVPGAGTVMLAVVLEAINVPVEGIALIFAMDRPLDMLRTSVNVTGDAAVSLLVTKTEGQLKV